MESKKKKERKMVWEKENVLKLFNIDVCGCRI